MRESRQPLIVGAVAGLILVVGTFISTDRVWSNLLIGSFFLLTIGLGGAVFIALTYVTGAGWNAAFRRIPEAMARIVPPAGVAIVIVLALRLNQYGWHHHGGGDAGTFWFKELWLTPSFWLARAVGYVAIWSLLGHWLVRCSRRPGDVTPEKFAARNTRLSALYLAVYAVTFSLAGADWLMALEPLWFSTIWGIYQFAGMIQAAFAVIVILGVTLSRPGRPLDGVFRTEHLHDLGKLILGFSCFWAYIWFSQYMLIWYSNIPEETSYFMTRTHGPWGPVVLSSIAINWLIPFFVLLPRPAKRSASVMVRVAVVVLIGRWIDLSLMVFPSTLVGEPPVIGLWELATVCCVIAVTVLLLQRSFRSADPVVSQDDPFLAESMHYHA